MISYIIFKDNKVLLNKSNNKYIFPKYEMDNEENLINMINKEFNTSVKVLDKNRKEIRTLAKCIDTSKLTLADIAAGYGATE